MISPNLSYTTQLLLPSHFSPASYCSQIPLFTLSLHLTPCHLCNITEANHRKVFLLFKVLKRVLLESVECYQLTWRADGTDPNFGQGKTLIMGLGKNSNSDILTHFRILLWWYTTFLNILLWGKLGKYLLKTE